MSMFRFWNSENRGSDKTVEGNPLVANCENTTHTTTSNVPELLTPISPRKRRLSFVDAASSYSRVKRAKTEEEHHGGLPSPTSACADSEESSSMLRGRSSSTSGLDLERAREVIQYQFGLEILLKHDELRLINQELAKCQVALEQLRRCHLIPYPVQCPTPSQMLEISSGKGPALQSKPGQPVPKWAPPFGVVEGPYARHYAKWLIPDPMFDGIQPEAPGLTETGRARNTTEGRATRNSVSDAGGLGKQRPARGNAGQRLHALSSGYPAPKDKHSPCILKRSDGITVKLVCRDCHRWDFSSTQGFINHCRIAHKRDYKSHEEAAVHAGHPIEVDESGAIVPDSIKTPAPAPVAAGASAPAGLVHPFARKGSVSDEETYKALHSRLTASLDLFYAGKLPNVNSIPGVQKPSRRRASRSTGLVKSSDAPYLSQLMQKKKLSGNLKQEVAEAKVKVDWELLSPCEDSDVDQPVGSDNPSAPAARVPAVMRMPARAVVPPSQPPTVTTTRSVGTDSPEVPKTPMYDDDMDVEMSPNTMASSHNAPSLVSDDGEYDDSDDDGSASDSSDAMETDSVSDVAEISIAVDTDGRVRTIHRKPKSNNNAVKLKKDEERHVTFVTPSPVPTNPPSKNRRKQNV
ncbi:hypothetical protein QBC38DRAFT_109752 [Podospora fimiseda]|uniref:AHC1-like C2H2 zinc-finger domain-containing protein n=1 Tax=Podospora fimiseda TaxID=252190 RepID=A0AAN7BTR6_9PEZI|nr:hypothetical protein QBC38DRAFT_109752 [Podospora fimiseda]